MYKKYSHIVQVHPVESGGPNLYKVRWEFEFDTKDEADDFINDYNQNDYTVELFRAVYRGCVNCESGELI